MQHGKKASYRGSVSGNNDNNTIQHYIIFKNSAFAHTAYGYKNTAFSHFNLSKDHFTLLWWCLQVLSLMF
jgi:hypothetical protein